MATEPPFTTRPEIAGTFGVAASTHWLASQSALGILERGGNAFDAAVAGGLVLQVVEPHLNGPGGEVPIILWSEREQRMRVICGQGPAPRLATPERFRALGLSLVPAMGLLPAAVPGAFAGWMTLLRDYGTLPLEDVLAPALYYAERGFPLVIRAVQAIAAVAPLFRDEWRTSADIWLPGGRLPAPGALFNNPQLAATYRRVLAEATAAGGSSRESRIDAAMATWYEGFVAEAIDSFAKHAEVFDTSGRRNRGLLRASDMRDWKCGYEEPVVAEFGRYSVAKCGLWSQGPVFLQQLTMLRHAQMTGMNPAGAEFIHLTAECMKLALADRLAWYGDSGTSPVRVEDLLAPEYARSRFGLIGPLASTVMQPGAPSGHCAALPDLAAAEASFNASDVRYGVGEPTFAELHPSEWAAKETFVGDTCHISVIDRWGNMASATPSGGWLSSSPAIPGLGFALGTRLQIAWLDKDLPATLTPGRRPLTTLSPGMAFRDGKPYMAFGTPGGDQQDQWSLTFFLRHAVFGMNLQEAIDAPAWHVDHSPSSFWPRLSKLNTLTVESRVPVDVIEDLRGMGHHVTVGPPWSEGRLSACSRESDAHGRLLLRAAANARGMQGYAVGR